MSQMQMPFPDDVPVEQSGPDASRIMHRLYGTNPGVGCGSCVHLRTQSHDDRWFFFCEESSIARGPDREWNVEWPACGLWLSAAAEWLKEQEKHAADQGASAGVGDQAAQGEA